MSKRIADLFAALSIDMWRQSSGFSPEMENANEAIFKSSDEANICVALNAWLQKSQPCLFGRLAAKLDLLSFCILTENDLLGSDEGIREKIQNSRTQWTRLGFQGRKSGFIVLAVSPKLVDAAPDSILRELALRLCSLYLLEDVNQDAIYQDEIFLEKPGSSKTTWKWLAGVNVFSANGDRRWWQDHRIPGGIGFSVNSVGHMVKSGRLANAMKELDEIVGGTPEGLTVSKIDSLDRALEFAMRTISMASEGPSGKSTELMPLPDDASLLPVSRCPVDLPSSLRDRNYCEYRGFYHTDITVPSEYFITDVLRPSQIQARTLDFTYLFNEDVNNPAFQTMAEGHRVRTAPYPSERFSKAEASLVSIDSVPRLVESLRS